MNNLFYVFTLQVKDLKFKYVHRSDTAEKAIAEVSDILRTRSKTKGKFKKLYKVLDSNDVSPQLYVESEFTTPATYNNTYRLLLDKVIKQYPNCILLNPKPRLSFCIYLLKIKTELGVYRYIGKTNNIRERLHSHQSKLRRNKHPNPLFQALNTKCKKLEWSIRPIVGGIEDEYIVGELERKYTLLAKNKYGTLSLNDGNGYKHSDATKQKIIDHVKKRNSKEYTEKIIKNSPRSRPITIDGVYYLSIGDAARKLNTHPPTIYKWIKKNKKNIVLHAPAVETEAKEIIIHGVKYASLMEAHRLTGISRKKLRNILNRV